VEVQGGDRRSGSEEDRARQDLLGEETGAAGELRKNYCGGNHCRHSAVTEKY